ncbi:hypothetical protein [Actinoplanes sp. NBRC 101535]|uniref:hypothetical protein n=1 Tax=Actinoplanes sp. NBRC 101535 TaxID=3032196 RepID=UPI0024A4F057|nr:hypothetical protein [Actinoplanes sp. NBRC 101535]GLY00647.1 hypothetical protein Acsp01_10260 [Actinoplanes sp. NBRC 101535]
MSKPQGPATTLLAVAVALTIAGCTDDSQPTTEPVASPATPPLTFEEAYQQVPMDGTERLPITWELTGAPDTDEVLAARRSLAYEYWLSQATDWSPIIAVGRYFYTDEYYDRSLAPYATTVSDNPYTGPIWAKVMGVEQTGTDHATVTFCADLGYWHTAQSKDAKVREARGSVQSYVMENITSADGEGHWLTAQRLDPDVDRRTKYGAECTKWAKHDKP